MMQYRRLGASGLKVSQLCLGCMSYGKGKWHSEWTLSEEDSLPFFQRALDAGINFFDTANAYGEGASEQVVGRVIRDLAPRDDLVIATKFFGPTGRGPNDRGASRKHIMAAVDASLKRLGTDYIDLYQIHRWDYETPFEETAQALDDIVRAGKVRYIGASSMFAWQFAKALAIQERNGWARFTSMQPQYNLVYREEEREMLPLCRDAGVGVIPWSPLARGFLAGNRSRDGGGDTARAKGDKWARDLYFRDDDFVVQERLAEVAAARGVPPMQVALAWIASRPGITAPIIGATKLYQLDEAIAALSLELSADEVARLEEPYQPHPVLGFS
ncbi:Predicted oxidoreductase [Sphingobium faniae]|nr:Predicted oxidoreductase [Sphingobium faniae]